MKENIRFKKVSIFCQYSNTYKRVIKDLSFEIKNSEILSIVSENEYERNILRKAFIKEANISSGIFSFDNEWINNSSQIKKITTVISQKEFDNVSSMQTALDFIIKNNNNEYSLDKEYEKKITKLKNELKKINKNIKIYSSPKSFYNNQHNLRVKNYRKYISENDRYISVQEKIYSEKNKLIKKVYRFKKNKEELLHKHSFDINDINISSKELINKKRKEVGDEIINLKKMLLKEKEEIKKRGNKVNSKNHHNEIVYNRLKKQSRRFVKHILGIEFTGIELSNDFKTYFQDFLEINTKKEFFENFDLLIEKIDLLTEVLGEKYIHKLMDWKAFLHNIEADSSAINTKTYGKVNDKILKDISKDIYFYERAIKDIDERLAIVDKSDKKEKIHLMRKTWELKRLSLRYEKQIMIEKLEVIWENRNKVIETSLSHSKLNINEFYNAIKNYKKKLLIIDVAFINWKKKQKIKALKLNLKQRIQINNDFIKKNNRLINELERSLDSSELYLAIKNSYISEFSSYSYERIKNKINNTSKKDFLDKYKKKIETLNNEKENLSYQIKETKNKRKLLKIELELKVLDLFDEVNLNASHTATLFSKLDETEMQKIFLVKSILKEKKFIIFSDQKFLDNEDMIKILRIFKEKYGVTFLILTKDIELASKISDTVVVIRDGELCEIISGNKILKNKIHPYTENIIKNIDEIRFKTRESEYIIEQMNTVDRTPYSVLDIHSVSKNHYVYSTKKEYDKWTNKIKK